MDLSKSTTEDDLLDMLGGDDKARKTSTDSMSDPFAEVGLEQEQEQAAEPKLEASTPATPIVHPTPPSAATVNTGNSPAPEINDKAITAQAKFLEERRLMQERLAARKKEKQKAKMEKEKAAKPAPAPTSSSSGPGAAAAPTSVSSSISAPTPAASQFTSVSVVEPTQRSEGGYFSSSNYWVYKVVVNNSSFVIRRFRDVVALHSRIHACCKGCILPPSPDRHSMRALEEGSTIQTLNFAMNRAEDMTAYFSDLIKHPIISTCEPLSVFLTLKDDLGTTWPEVSSSTVTRMKEKASVNFKMEFKKFNVGDVSEDSIEIGDVVTAETERLNVILQAVPKLESATVLLKEQSEYAGDVGMEMTKLIKDTSSFLPPASSAPLRILSTTLLRSGRRSKRGSMELSAAVAPLSRHHMLVDNVKKAFGDRKEAIQIRLAAKRTVEAKTIKVNQLKANRETPLEQIRQAEMELDVARHVLKKRVVETKAVGDILVKEVGDLSAVRRREYMQACKIMASSFAETCLERKAIWEQAKAAFLEECGVGEGEGEVGSEVKKGEAQKGGEVVWGENGRGRSDTGGSAKSIDM
ncbi:hypothetical protein TrRE_jg3899 [Triparma retinervis]|uniref:PX domain-containing protein n=1 Tax=Triparma retinervis TaxID=2557542 RepID=A0A9W6ZTD1_9STRA|nr:hypothetical protein TrRE_jg3899 [Triparma retinervis]